MEWDSWGPQKGEGTRGGPDASFGKDQRRENDGVLKHLIRPI